jgi:hypothetical protein
MENACHMIILDLLTNSHDYSRPQSQGLSCSSNSKMSCHDTTQEQATQHTVDNNDTSIEKKTAADKTRKSLARPRPASALPVACKA